MLVYPDMLLTKVLSLATLSLSLIACTSSVVTGTGSGDDGQGQGEPPQCSADPDCAAFDTDQDACTTAICQYGRCTQKLIKDTPECQCHEATDCTYFERKACNEIACEAHKCIKKIVPAGPSPTQEAGDCSTAMCDGTSEVATKQYDEQDIGDTSNPCITKSCSPDGGLLRGNVTDGTACGDGSICFTGSCLACKPQNASSCGGEGPGEPSNDSSSTPANYPQNQPFCAFSSGSDIDWYTFYAEDGDFTHDVYNFSVWSTAPTIEVCIYVKCGSGSPGGACGTKLPGPNGSQGCCWTGAPASVKPTWDLDCSGTGDDAGTTYVSVRAPGGSTCEPYAIVGGY